ncbi:MAG: pyruvate synthase, partial [Oscillospiraceae bacterium]|nr:pyruvate synthase [Oscillospiraceae bacterium]
ISSRLYKKAEGHRCEGAETVMFILGSAYHTAALVADELHDEGIKAGVCTINVLRPFPKKEICEYIRGAENVIICDRQDSYGGDGGNMSFEIKSAMLDAGIQARVITRIYGLGGQDFLPEDARSLFTMDFGKCEKFDYIGQNPGSDVDMTPYFDPIKKSDAQSPFTFSINGAEENMTIGTLAQVTCMPQRISPGHGACPGCGIPVNVNLLLKGISGNVVLLFQTGCGMIITTPYPKTAFKVPYLHNLFQNGAATLSGLERMFESRRRRGEIPDEDITFVMVSGDGGMDIGMGSAIGAALRNSNLIIFEYDNGGYMNTGYQLSYSTPKGAKSSTSHVGKMQYGKSFFHKDTPEIMAASNTAYVATVAESEPVDFIKKAAKAQAYAREYGTAYIKALSACPLNWNDRPDTERRVIDAAVKCRYFPLYEVCRGITKITVDPGDKKIPVSEWLGMMGRTKHLLKDEYADILADIQSETDRRWERLVEKSRNPLL